MRIAIIGAGAVGSYFGGRLAQVGNEVAFLARGKHLAALRQRPLRVESTKGDFEVKVRATDVPEEIGAVDAVLVAVKTWQVVDAATLIPPMLGSDSVVVPLQNGVEAPDHLASVLGPGPVAGGMCKILAYTVAPAHVRHAGVEPYVAFGELRPPSESTRLSKLRSEFLRAGVTCEIPSDITATMWEKFIFIASMSGVGAVTRLTIGEMRSAAGSRAHLEQAIRETVEVAHAHNVGLPTDIVARTLRFVDGFPAEGTSSMHRDIIGGFPSELEAQNGAVVRLGAAVGVATPTHEAIYAALLPLERRARAG